MARHTVSRTLHDAGLAAWFGGSLANAVALNAAAGQAGSSKKTGRVATIGWDRWTPVNAAAIGAHLAGSAVQLRANRHRVAGQQGVAGMSAVKTALTVAALAVTAYSRALGAYLSGAGNVPARSGTKPRKRTKADVAAAQEQLDSLQWVVPALTGSLIAVSAYAGEQQRPSEVSRGMARS